MNRFKFFFAVMAMATVFFACKKRNIDVPTRATSADVAALDPTGVDVEMGQTRSAGMPVELRQEAEVFYDNLKTVAYATGALIGPAEKVPYELVADNDSTVFINPISLKLQNLDIIDEDTGRKISFYDLDGNQKDVFLDKLLAEERLQLSEKLAAEPSLWAIFERENYAISEVIKRNELTEFNVIDEEDEELKFVKNDIYKQSKMVPAAELFKQINEEITKVEKEEVETRFIGGLFTKPKANPENVKRMLVKHSRRGDFLLTLPLHGMPGIYLNPISDFNVGHAGIISEKVTNATKTDRKISIDALTRSGVTKTNIHYWSVPCYVMGIQKVEWVWKWEWFRSRLYRRVTPVSKPGALADWAEKYIGREYVRWYEFPVAKWAAPTRFTCTTLVWWCAKKAYGINVSSWYSTMITPSGLLTDESTYIRGEVLS